MDEEQIEQENEKKFNEQLSFVVEKSGKSKDEILALIDAKKEAMYGLVSKFGAIRAIAKTLNVNLDETIAPPEMEDLNSLQDKHRINVEAKIVSAFPKKDFPNGKTVRDFKISDGKTEVKVTVWAGSPDANMLIANGNRGDLIRIVNGYGRENEFETRAGEHVKEVVLTVGDGTRVELNPKDMADIKAALSFRVTPYVKVSEIIDILKQNLDANPHIDDNPSEGFNVSIKGVVTSVPKIEKKKNRSGEDYEFYSFTVSDEVKSKTSIDVALYKESCDLELTDQVDIKNGYAKINRSGVKLLIGQYGTIEKFTGLNVTNVKV